MTLDDAVSNFGKSATAKLNSKAVAGAPEAQIRAPFETFIREAAGSLGFAGRKVEPIDETSVADIHARPDYSIVIDDFLVGHVELKAPGKGVDPRRFRDKHDKKQWKKLKALPNLLYFDGNGLSLWRDGMLERDLVLFAGDCASSGDRLSAPPELAQVLTDFLQWAPTAPTDAKQLAQTSARLCRLLRDQVEEQIEAKNAGLLRLQDEWKDLLFPDSGSWTFADSYAQAVTFGLLVARVHDINLDDDLSVVANALRKDDSLIGTALRLLVDEQEVRDGLKTSLGTLRRVLGVVDWPTVSKKDPEAWLLFYEDFLAVYDSALRKKTGSYYTPPEVVSAMVRLTDEALKMPRLFGIPKGLASSDVTVCDPATGTGTFMLGVLDHVARYVEADMGPGAVGSALNAMSKRLFGFELQFGPFAVAQLRLLAELEPFSTGSPSEVPPVYLTDTLDDPYAKRTSFSALVAPIGKSAEEAARIKREEKITVVIGNPPYKEKAKGLGGWIEDGSAGHEAPMEWWRPPISWGVGAHTKHLKNLYVYFWRWATLHAFRSGWAEATGDAPEDDQGIVCFITTAGFLNGPGFQKMREDMRRECSDIWVIECTPEGHQPPVASRIFQGVQQPVCIVLAARAKKTDHEAPATVRFFELPEGDREDKFATLAGLSLIPAGPIASPIGKHRFYPQMEVNGRPFRFSLICSSTTAQV